MLYFGFASVFIPFILLVEMLLVGEMLINVEDQYWMMFAEIRRVYVVVLNFTKTEKLYMQYIVMLQNVL